MDYRLITRGFNASDSLKEYLEKKTLKLDKVIPEGDHVHLEVKIEREKSRFDTEFTLHIRGGVVRTECSSEDVYITIDSTVDSLEKKMQKYKEKRLARHKVGHKSTVLDLVEEKESEDEDVLEIARSKRFFLRPMDLEEAKLQLEMLGHNFFVFKRDETDEVNLIYKRKNGSIGLIEFEV